MNQGRVVLAYQYVEGTTREAPTVMVDEMQFQRAFPSDPQISDGSGSLGEWGCGDAS